MMATAPPLFATVLHLKTGHVLAAVSSAGLKPTLDDLTVAEHLRVRFPGTSGFVNVPNSLLTATWTAVTTADVLDRPQHYVLGADKSLLGPKDPAFQKGFPPGDAAKEAIVVWQAGSQSHTITGPLGTVALPGSVPVGATHRLVVYAGSPLHLDTLLGT
jgi:hypothetical protein